MLLHNASSHSTMSTKERWKRAVHILPLTRKNIRTTERMIARAPHVQAHRRTFNRPITWSLARPCCIFILQQSHIDAKYIAGFNAFASHNICFRSCEFSTNTFSYAIFSAILYYSNLNFSVVRIFCRFCSCAKCERVFKIILCQENFIRVLKNLWHVLSHHFFQPPSIIFKFGTAMY